MKNIIFDRSGTLMDNLTPVYEASMILFEQLGHDRITLDEYKRNNISPYMKFWNKYFPNLTAEQQNEMFSNAIQKVKQPTLYPYVHDVLQKLHKDGCKIILLSSQPTEELLSKCQENNIQQTFDGIIGDIHDKKEVISDILEKYHLDPSHTLFVGDTNYEVEVGKYAGLITVALSR